ncbi:MAG: hypothetical protein DLM61_27165 [Pseudonocardiales bacterium]|nr:MAG: hypothetical protein DLM61_27165 [Pseudonocardiales bacterium]
MVLGVGGGGRVRRPTALSGADQDDRCRGGQQTDGLQTSPAFGQEDPCEQHGDSGVHGGDDGDDRQLSYAGGGKEQQVARCLRLGGRSMPAAH